VNLGWHSLMQGLMSINTSLPGRAEARAWIPRGTAVLTCIRDQDQQSSRMQVSNISSR